MKKNNLFKALLLSGIIVVTSANLFKALLLSGIIVVTSATSIFANSHVVDPSFTKTELVAVMKQRSVSSQVLYTINTPTQDTFMVKENRLGQGTEFTEFELYHRINSGKKRIDFTLIADEGTTLGTLENSASVYSSEKLEDGRTKYTFFYSLFSYKPQRVININVTSK